jgi:hypothetical protein
MLTRTHSVGQQFTGVVSGVSIKHEVPEISMLMLSCHGLHWRLLHQGQLWLGALPNDLNTQSGGGGTGYTEGSITGRPQKSRYFDAK